MHHQYTVTIHIYNGVYRGFLLASSLSKGLTTTCDHDSPQRVAFVHHSKACAIVLVYHSPFMTYRTSVPQNLFDMVVPTTVKTFNPFTLCSSFLGPLVQLAFHHCSYTFLL